MINLVIYDNNKKANVYKGYDSIEIYNDKIFIYENNRIDYSISLNSNDIDTIIIKTFKENKNEA